MISQHKRKSIEKNVTEISVNGFQHFRYWNAPLRACMARGATGIEFQCRLQQPEWSFYSCEVYVLSESESLEAHSSSPLLVKESVNSPGHTATWDMAQPPLPKAVAVSGVLKAETSRRVLYLTAWREVSTLHTSVG